MKVQEWSEAQLRDYLRASGEDPEGWSITQMRETARVYYND